MVSKSLKEEEAALHPQIIHLSSTLLATVGSAKPLGACCEPWCRLERPSSGHSSSSSGCREYHLNSSRGLIVLELIYFFSHWVFQSQITGIWLGAFRAFSAGCSCPVPSILGHEGRCFPAPRAVTRSQWFSLGCLFFLLT